MAYSRDPPSYKPNLGCGENADTAVAIPFKGDNYEQAGKADTDADGHCPDADAGAQDRIGTSH